MGRNRLNVDAWVEYSRVLTRKRVRWDAQRRAQSVLNDRSVAPWTALDDGVGGRFVEQRLRPNALGVSLSMKFAF